MKCRRLTKIIDFEDLGRLRDFSTALCQAQNFLVIAPCDCFDGIFGRCHDPAKQIYHRPLNYGAIVADNQNQ